MINKSQLPWLLIAAAFVLIHETTWYSAPYWLPWFQRVIASIGSPVLPTIAITLWVTGASGFIYHLYHARRQELTQ